jgi:voltage-gated potassium channel
MTEGAIGPEAAPSLRRRLHLQLDPRARQARGLSTINRVLAILILVATALAIAETEPVLTRGHMQAFEHAEMALGTIFLVEYLARLWVAPEAYPALSAFRARLRFAVSLAAIADLAAVIGSLGLAFGTGTLILRLVRLLRILRLAKLGRMSRAFHHMADAIATRREELLLSLCAGLFLMIVSATLLYLVESGAQPDEFGSIPRALWWAVATLTTIGYGDIYPITPLGKALAGITAIFGIGLIAMPTGIVAAAFSDAMQRRREDGGLDR